LPFPLVRHKWDFIPTTLFFPFFFFLSWFFFSIKRQGYAAPVPAFFFFPLGTHHLASTLLCCQSFLSPPPRNSAASFFPRGYEFALFPPLEETFFFPFFNNARQAFHSLLLSLTFEYSRVGDAPFSLWMAVFFFFPPLQGNDAGPFFPFFSPPLTARGSLNLSLGD